MVLSVINVFADYCVGVGLGCGGISLTFRMPAAPLQVPFMNTSTCFCTVMLVSANVAVQPSPHSCPMDIIDPDWRWGKMWDVLALVDSNGLRLNSALWVVYTRLPSGRITRGPCVVLNLLLQGVSTLMYFCVAPVSAMPYVGLFLGGFPLQLSQLLSVCFKYSSTLVISLLSDLSLLLSIVLDPNRLTPSRMPLLLPPILFKDIDVYLWTPDLYLHASPSCLPNPWVQQYLLLQQFPFL